MTTASPTVWRVFPLRPTDPPVRRFAVLAVVGAVLVATLGGWLFARSSSASFVI